MRIASYKRRAAMSMQVGDCAFRDPCHRQPTGEGMPERVPVHACQTQLLYRRKIVPSIEISWVRMCRRVLARKHPHRKRPGVEPPQQNFRLFIQPDILDATRLCCRQAQCATFKVYVFPTKAELFQLSHARQECEANPGRIRFTQFLTENRFFLWAKKAVSIIAPMEGAMKSQLLSVSEELDKKPIGINSRKHK